MKKVVFLILALAATVPTFSQVNQSASDAGVLGKIKFSGSRSSIASVSNALMVIDGIVVNGSKFTRPNQNNEGSSLMPVNLSLFSPGNIDSMSVLEPAKAMAIYGSAAVNGAVLVFTKGNTQPQADEMVQVLTDALKKSNNRVVYLDGAVINDIHFSAAGELSYNTEGQSKTIALGNGRIESVTILNPSASSAGSLTEGPDGALLIKTKK